MTLCIRPTSLRSGTLAIILAALLSMPYAVPLGSLAAMAALTALPQTAHAEKRETNSATVLKRARLRSAPNLASSNIMVLESGASVEILSEQPPFVEVKSPSGKVGWVARRLLNLPAKPLPPASVAPLEAAQPVAAATAPPLETQPEPPRESSLPWGYALAFLAVGIALGFGLGYYLRDRRLRRRFYSLRV